MCYKPCTRQTIVGQRPKVDQQPPLPPLSRLNREHQFSMYVVLYVSRCTTCEMSQLPTAVQIGTVDRGAGGPPLVPPGGNPTSHTPKMPSSPTFVVPPGEQPTQPIAIHTNDVKMVLPLALLLLHQSWCCQRGNPRSHELGQ